MLRDIVLSIAVLACLRISFRYPYAGVLTWTWLTLMQPHREAYGPIVNSLRLNLMVAVVTILAWYYSKERKNPQPNATLVLTGIFFAWMTLGNFTAYIPEYSWDIWDRIWRILALSLLIMVTATDKLRIHALIWVMVVSLCYYGVKGGLLTIMTGGAKTITGPAGTNIADNNQLALVLLMVLPLVYYLWLETAHRWVRRGLLGAGLLTFLSIVGSYSRGAYLALVALSIVGWLRVRGVGPKLIYPILIVSVAFPALAFMPQSFYDRLNTFYSLRNDLSYQGRLTAWQVGYDVAIDRFPMGAGFQGPEQDGLYHTYFPDEPSRAAHSIYFQVLGEHGFVGLAMYIVILLMAFAHTRKIRKLTQRHPELSWAHNLATMIQLSLLAFCTGGAALSDAYYDLFWIWLGLLPALKSVVSQIVRQQVRVPVGLPAFASI